MMSFVADSLGKSDSYVWGNIFFTLRDHRAVFGLNTLSIECLACYFSGYHLEDYFLLIFAQKYRDRAYALLLS